MRVHSDTLSHPRALSYLAITVFLWSFWSLLTKSSPLSALSFCFFSLGAGVVVQSLLSRKIPSIPKGPLLLPLLLYFCFNISVFSATKLTTAANTLMLQFCSPAFSMLLAWLLLKQRPQRRELFVVPCIALGIVIYFWDRVDGEHTLGNVLALASGVCLAGYNLALKRNAESTPVEIQVAGAICLMTLLLLPTLNDPALSFSTLGLPILNGIITGAGWWFYLRALPSVSSTTALIMISPEAVLNPLLVGLVLGEVPTPWGLVGGMLIFVSVFTFSLVRERRVLGT